MSNTNYSNIKTVVISLKESNIRRNHIFKTLHSLELYNYSVFNAVNGKNIELFPVFNNRIFLVKEPQYKRHYYYDSAKRLNNAGLKNGDLGCSISHLMVYEQLVNDPDNDYYLIFEDDASENVSKETIHKFLNNLPSPHQYDLAHLCISDYFPFEKEVDFNAFYYIPKKNFFNRLTAYVITKTGALKLLLNNSLIGLTADDNVSNLFLFSNNFRVIVPNNTLFKHDDYKFNSDTEKINNMEIIKN